MKARPEQTESLRRLSGEACPSTRSIGSGCKYRAVIENLLCRAFLDSSLFMTIVSRSPHTLDRM